MGVSPRRRVLQRLAGTALDKARLRATLVTQHELTTYQRIDRLVNIEPLGGLKLIPAGLTEDR